MVETFTEPHAKLHTKAKDFISQFITKNSTEPIIAEANNIIQELISSQKSLLYRIEELEYNEVEFQTERDYFKDIFNNQPVGLYRIRSFSSDKWSDKDWLSSTNPPYSMEFASKQFCEILEISDTQFKLNPYILSDLIYEADKKSFGLKNEEAKKLLIPFSWEGRLMVNRKIKWVRFESVPNKLPNNDILWTGILYDIAAQKNTKNEFSKARLDLEDVLEGANIGTLEWNVQTGKMKFNKIWAKNLGYSSTEIKIAQFILGGNGWKSITHPDDVPYAEEMLHRHFSGELPTHSVEVRMRHKKGYWVWIRQEGKVRTWTPDGKPLLMYGTHTDITKRKNAEQALFELNEQLESRIVERTSELTALNNSLREAELKFRTVANFTYDWEYWISTDNHIIFMSPSVERVTGYTAEEFEHNMELLNTIIHPSDAEQWKNRNNNTCDKDIELTLRIINKKGEIRWLNHLQRSVFVDGKYLGVRVSNRDITEKVLAENRLLNITVDVEERERNRFSSELHDGMGPLLSTIKLYFQWLSDTKDDEKRKLITEKGNFSIEMAIQTARELAKGLSSQFLSETGFVNAIKDFTQRINDTNKMSIRFDTNSDERFSGFMELMLYRITTELIKNTITYSQAENIYLQFHLDRQNEIISFKYSDNGLGFDWEKVRHEQKGLGLMNILNRVQIMKGTIVINSKIGEGMSVSISLPIEQIEKKLINN